MHEKGLHVESTVVRDLPQQVHDGDRMLSCDFKDTAP